MVDDTVSCPYRPSNGTEGMAFEARFCQRCERDREWREFERNPCEVLGAALSDGAPEWLCDGQGAWCTAFVPERTPGEPEPPPVLEGQLPLFEVTE